MSKVADAPTAPKGDRTQTSAVYEKIRTEIMNGTLPAGSRLKTRHLAERLNVGLSPIREALSRLSSEGWVSQSDRRGFSVVPVSIEELWDIHTARCLLNEAGLRTSIEHGDTDWEDAVLLSCIQLGRLQRPDDMSIGPEGDLWNTKHREFHLNLVSACRSQRLIQYCGKLFDEIERYRRLGLTHGARRSSPIDEHQQIANAAVARDADLAVELLNSHFAKTVEQVETVIQENAP